jgi:hypothetical protein
MKRDEFTRRTKDQAYTSDRNRKSRINFRNAARPEAFARPHKSTASGPHATGYAARKRERSRAYRRGDLFDKRRKLMDAWAAYCAKLETDAAKVVALARARTPR